MNDEQKSKALALLEECKKQLEESNAAMIEGLSVFPEKRPDGLKIAEITYSNAIAADGIDELLAVIENE